MMMTEKWTLIMIMMINDDNDISDHYDDGDDNHVGMMPLLNESQ